MTVPGKRGVKNFLMREKYAVSSVIDKNPSVLSPCLEGYWGSGVELGQQRMQNVSKLRSLSTAAPGHHITGDCSCLKLQRGFSREVL